MRNPLGVLILLFVSALLLAPSVVVANPCTNEEMATFNKSLSAQAFLKECPKSVAASSLTGVDMHSLSNASPCGDDQCLVYLKKLAATAPECEVEGMSQKMMMQALFFFCSTKPTIFPANPGNNSPSSPNSPTLPVPLTQTPTIPRSTSPPVSLPLDETVPDAVTTTSPPLMTTPRPLAVIKSAASYPRAPIVSTLFAVAVMTVVIATV